MNERVFNCSLNIIRKYISENMAVGTSGFTGASSPEGPVAGFDPVMDGRSNVMKRLPKEYSKLLRKKKKNVYQPFK
jgi:hypothetical protein